MNPQPLRAVNGQILLPFFTKDYVFSNHYQRRNLFEIGGVKYDSTEKYYMCRKAQLFAPQYESQIMRARTAGQTKMIGNAIEKLPTFRRKIWMERKIEIMEIALRAKFFQNPDLRDRLLATSGKILVEASPRDIFWGAGLSKDSWQLLNPKRWPGQNKLGQMLGNIREELWNQEAERAHAIVCAQFFQEQMSTQKKLKRLQK
ncbi:N-glycosidase [Ditylenchus destructor]|nr:N-glycosidase [Ditylenchus destructor]